MKEQVANKASNNPIYGLGFIGAVIFYLSQATGIVAGLIGFLKAVVWPAFVVYELLSFLHG